MPADPSDETPSAQLLRTLMGRLYLSTACAADDHRRCRLVSKYSGLPCCCTRCRHTHLDGSPPPAITPLLHLAEDGRYSHQHTYFGDQLLGVRTDMVQAMNRVLDTHVPEERREALAYDLAVAAALIFAPRSA
ncbi:hypothetical protein [Actinacidiphila glaucinigra]|uniref:hypothetical protein n=1 Tax=Actinacidiphila glaucinigra TaxID=235986 RepID=UPI003670C26C